MSPDSDYDFEWDPAKARANVRKHGVRFDDAATVFLDPLALTVYDPAASQDEERWFTLGLDKAGKLIAVAHTYAGAEGDRFRVRIISARPATAKERRNYENEPQKVDR
jgi:uncharacterized DUF497 family protein